MVIALICALFTAIDVTILCSCVVVAVISDREIEKMCLLRKN